MRSFLDKDDGYAIVLALIFMPVLLGFSLFAMDASRATNAHSDVQAIADAVALAGARELDGSPNSIDRAKAAMAQITNSVAFLSNSDTSADELTYEDADGNQFNVIFLRDIPASDDTPIDQAWVDDNGTNSGFEAGYVYVSVRSDNLQTFFPRPTLITGASIPIQASAVATYRSSACDVTPLFICNPFENEFTDLPQAFADGHMHGRLVKLHPKGSDTAGPGNFGFLQVENDSGNQSSSAAAIRAMFAGEDNPTCYDSRRVVTKPGAANGIRHGLNTRFDIYEGPYSGKVKDFPPAVNVRKGYVPASKGKGNECNVVPSTDLTQATGFPPNATMTDPNPSNPGAFIGSGNWNLSGNSQSYWTVNHPGKLLPADLDSINSMPDATYPGSSQPSRYDVYRYEIKEKLIADVSAGGESGTPACYNSKKGNGPDASDDPDRRVIFAAIINCNENDLQGASEVPVAAFASAFLVNPMEKVAGNDPDVPDKTIDLEIIDITGSGGKGTLDEFVRQEALLVR